MEARTSKLVLCFNLIVTYSDVTKFWTQIHYQRAVKPPRQQYLTVWALEWIISKLREISKSLRSSGTDIENWEYIIPVLKTIYWTDLRCWIQWTMENKIKAIEIDI